LGYLKIVHHPKIITVINRHGDSDYFKILSLADGNQTLKVAQIVINFDPSVLYEWSSLVVNGEPVEFNVESVDCCFDGLQVVEGEFYLTNKRINN
jgi:hypothetical protein